MCLCLLIVLSKGPSDGEGAVVKTFLRRLEFVCMRYIRDTYAAFEACTELLTSPQHHGEKLRHTILRRSFHYVANNVVNHKKRDDPGPLKNITKHHSFCFSGEIGEVVINKRSCFKCESCWKMDKSKCKHQKVTGEPWEPPGGSMSLKNENADAINTRAKAQAADIAAAMAELEPGMNVAFKYEGTGKYGIGRVVTKPRVLDKRTRTDTEWMNARAKVVDVEMYEDTTQGGARTLTLALGRCGRLYCDCGPDQNCNLQHAETKQIKHILTYGFKLATPRRSGRAASTSTGELKYYLTDLAEQQIKNSFGKYSLFPRSS